MSSETDQLKRIEKEDIVFTGYSGKVSFNQFDVTTLKCKGQALLSVEEVGIDNASSLRKPLKKQYGGASEDMKHKEEIFKNGMPDKGKKLFPKGIDIESKLRQLVREWQELILL
jgi:hypothetical protein